MKYVRVPIIVAIVAMAAVLTLFAACQRQLLYFPTHEGLSQASLSAGFAPWQVQAETIGYARVVERPRRVWLFIYGNGGEAAQRHWALHCFNPRDSIYVLEYPGFGLRAGAPSRGSFNAAALAAFRALQATVSDDQLIVLGESLGSGPASYLATVPNPPRRLVLMVPFDVLTEVAKEKFPYLPVGLLLRDKWDNVAALTHFSGKIDIFGATYDQVIPVAHARNLAAHVPGAVYHEFPGDHGWTAGELVDLSQIE
jgi:pimeloyl-ACP methyl ester carboxylesterase